MSAKTPCHKCKFYDHGTTKDPKQRCRVDIPPLTAGEGVILLKPLVFNGCEKFQPRERFEADYPNLFRDDVH